MSQESLLVVVVPANGEWEPMPALWEVRFWSELPAGAVVHDAPLVPVGVVDALYAKLAKQRPIFHPELAAKNERQINRKQANFIIAEKLTFCKFYANNYRCK